jgi:hypothetical protein
MTLPKLFRLLFEISHHALLTFFVPCDNVIPTRKDAMINKNEMEKSTFSRRGRAGLLKSIMPPPPMVSV